MLGIVPGGCTEPRRAVPLPEDMKLSSLIRRIRVGPPIVVVSGLPRSGTSMMMRMLEAGGVPIVADGVRTADVSNPRGYFELEAVKELDKPGRPLPWLPAARGRAVKIISFLLTWLPEDYDYRVIFMDRDLDEVLASQHQMLERRGEAPADAARQAADMRATYESHLTQVRRFLGVRPCFSTLEVSYRDAVADPSGTAARVAAFLGRRLDTAAMARAVEASLYRNRV